MHAALTQEQRKKERGEETRVRDKDQKIEETKALGAHPQRSISSRKQL